jgi:C4-dicarboxylate-specific signal transduction histidine kinase
MHNDKTDQENKKSATLHDPLTSTGLLGRTVLPHIGHLNRRAAVLLAALLGVWFLISYLAVSSVTQRQFDADLQRQYNDLEQTATAVAYHFERSFAFLDVIPETVADNMVLISSLRSFAGQKGWQNLAPEKKRAFLTSHPGLAELNQHLIDESRSLGVDVIWILSSNGDCIASSNHDRAESFVGVDYKDRSYYKSAMAGQSGRQYAVGRQTNIPGFFFSSPIRDKGKIIGAVIAKIDVSRLSQWFNRFNCFITDGAGVIVISSDKIIEHYAMTDSLIFQMSPQDRERQYKRQDFPLLNIGSYGNTGNSYLSTVFPGSNVPYLLVRSEKNKDGYTLFSYAKINDAEKLQLVTWQHTILIFIAGAALILLAGGIVRYLRDMRHSMAVTEKARKELQTLNETLEDRVREEVQKNREKAGMMLHQDKMASIGQLAAGVAHEINNPIGFISSNLGTLRNYADRLDQYITEVNETLTNRCGDEVREEVAAARSRLKIDYVIGDIHPLLDESSEGVERVKKIILDLKTFSRDEGIGAEKAEVDLNNYLESTINIVWNEIKYVAELKKEFGDLPPIRCYPQQIGQVFINLLVNAAQAITNHGEITVRTWTDGESAFVSVSDTGCGITPENLKKIFDAFFTTKEVGKGTGLGLSISSEIIKKHGGALTVESILGKGSIFTVRLPLKVSRKGNS